MKRRALRPVVARGGKSMATSKGELMSFRFTTQTIFGTTAMIALGAALAAAQDTSKVKPRSDRRIPISKEAPGEVVRTDTVTLFKTDTLRLTTRVVDTLRLTNTVTVTRVDTVIPTPPPIRLPNGFYAGLAAGFSTPAGALYTPNGTGGTAQAQLGWQNAKQVLGVRLDANGAWPGQDSRFSNLQGQARLMNFSADGKVQLPFVNHLFGAEHRFALYGIGGYTYTMYKNLPMRVDSPDGNENIACIRPGQRQLAQQQRVERRRRRVDPLRAQRAVRRVPRARLQPDQCPDGAAGPRRLRHELVLDREQT